MTISGKPWLHWPADTVVEEGVWRDYYTGEKLEDYAKPWRKGEDEKVGVGRDCLNMFIWRPKSVEEDLSQAERDLKLVDRSWWESRCAGPVRGCPCNNDKLPPLLSLRGLCPSSLLKLTLPELMGCWLRRA